MRNLLEDNQDILVPVLTVILLFAGLLSLVGR